MKDFVEIKGYNGIYFINRNGVVIRKDSVHKRGNHYVKVKGKIMKPLDNGMGYLRIKLTKDTKTKRHMLHRLIANAFIPKIEGKDYINHINGNKKDNRIENLEWCTQSENTKHAWNLGLKTYTEKMYEARQKQRKVKKS